MLRFGICLGRSRWICLDEASDLTRPYLLGRENFGPDRVKIKKKKKTK